MPKARPNSSLFDQLYQRFQSDSSLNQTLLVSASVIVTFFFMAALTFPAQSTFFSALFPKDESSAAGTTYYVDVQNGSDANAGTTESNAWKTLAKVSATTFAPGDRILLKRGQTWNEGIKMRSSGTASNLITIGAYGSGSAPTLYGARRLTTTWTRHSGNIWRTNADLSIVRLSGEKAVWEQPETDLDKKGEWSRRHDLNTGITYIYAESDPNTYYGGLGIEVGEIRYLIDLSNQQYIRVEQVNLVGAGSRGVYIDNAGGDGGHVISSIRVESPLYTGVGIEDSNSNRVENSTFLNGARDGVSVIRTGTNGTANANVLVGNTVSGFSNHGLWVMGYRATFSADRNEIVNNVAFDNGDGAYITYSKYTIVRGNHLYNNHRREWQGGEGYGLGVQSTSFAEISYNNMHDNRTSGVEVWGGEVTAENPGYGRSDGNKIIGNRFARNEYGVFFSSNYSNDSLVAYNFIYANQKNGLLWGHPDGANNRVFNNTFVSNPIGISYYNNANMTVHNNLFANNGRAFNLTTASLLSNNGYWNNDIGYGGTVYAGDTIKTVDSEAVLGNPAFINEASDDYHLSSTSPYLNKGRQISELTQDIDQQSIVGVPDIGADEVSTQSQTSATPTLPVSTPSPTTLPPSATPTVAPTPTAFPPVTGVSVLTKTSPLPYSLSYLVVGALPFTDRTVTLTDIPAAYKNLVLLKTPNEDRTRTDVNLITLSLSRGGTFYIAVDSRASVPSWITSNGWLKTNDKITLSESDKTHDVYRKTVGAGQVTLSGANLDTNYFNYYAFIQLNTTATPTPTRTPIPYSADINGDGRVNVFDLGILAAYYGKNITDVSSALERASDINQDGAVNVFDLGILISQYER